MKILFCTSEIFPYSKTGGLADVAGSLPLKLNMNKDIETRVITPYYKSVIPYHEKLEYVGQAYIRLYGITTICHYYSLKHENFEIIFVQNQHYFERDNFYGYADDAERFSIFSFACLEYIKVGSFIPQIMHLNDWECGMIPYLLDAHYRYKEEYKYIHTLLSIHNLEYQGSFDTYVARYFNTAFDYTYIHFNRVNFLKAGIMRATYINTVSPNYLEETLTEEYGFSLDGALSSRSNNYLGILNGIDTNFYNPKTDKYITYNYSLCDFLEKKKLNKIELLKEYGIEITKNTPLFSIISRLTSQKGIDLLMPIIENIIFHNDILFFFLGSGESKYEEFFNYLKNKYPTKVMVYIGYNERLAHRIYASSDFFLMPSLFEPCGLSQLISYAYGTIPIVRETGGLKDTVIPYNKFEHTGTGFSFKNRSSAELESKILEAFNLYVKEDPDLIDMQKRVIGLDYSLTNMSLKYIELYNKIIKGE
jgi:starch synthase